MLFCQKISNESSHFFSYGKLFIFSFKFTKCSLFSLCLFSSNFSSLIILFLLEFLLLDIVVNFLKICFLFCNNIVLSKKSFLSLLEPYCSQNKVKTYKKSGNTCGNKSNRKKSEKCSYKCRHRSFQRIYKTCDKCRCDHRTQCKYYSCTTYYIRENEYRLLYRSVLTCFSSLTNIQKCLLSQRINCSEKCDNNY